MNVGQKARAFHVHLGKLGPIAKLLDPSESLQSISLPEDHAEAFNAVVNWIYNEPLPRAAKTCKHVNDAKNLVPLSTGTMLLGDHDWGKYFPSASYNRHETSKATGMAMPGDKPLKEAQETQCMLLDIMMMAERWEWEQLYNAAIDAFREGEANLERERPSLLHIEVVYLRTSAGSPIRQFLGDYAYSLAKMNRNMSFYLQEKWFEAIPDLLEDMMRRMDGKGPFAYPLQRPGSKDGESSKDGGEQCSVEILAEEAPLDLAATTYHIHGGRMVLDCQRSDNGGCIVE